VSVVTPQPFGRAVEITVDCPAPWQADIARIALYHDSGWSERWSCTGTGSKVIYEPCFDGAYNVSVHVAKLTNSTEWLYVEAIYQSYGRYDQTKQPFGNVTLWLIVFPNPGDDVVFYDGPLDPVMSLIGLALVIGTLLVWKLHRRYRCWIERRKY